MIHKLRRRIRPWFLLWAIIMWVLLQGALTVAHVLAGAVLGCLVMFALPLPAIPRGNIHINYRELLRLALIWLIGLVRGACSVSWLALRPQAPPKTAIVQVPMRVESELIFALATSLYNLQPGGSVTDIDVGNRVWTVHLLDAHSPEKIMQQRADIARLERQFIRAFERSNHGS
ncbi:Na+/H+ antiporter subunit E [Corynebacterium sp. sy039]|uniref:Na+/H+ antiporter subunit E n=1 Tax=Corynebacterium sp. sy039 TaxID=2599641 RepID=UPI0011B4BAE6|nr:Na+/H+ antiporter subunit E [Corynebacterium sp. sy039]QDZ41890.1 Na+/H+ antiporter subunit E [Corynebacterium sp. sy039]